jgi:hypothetical protein
MKKIDRGDLLGETSGDALSARSWPR